MEESPEDIINKLLKINFQLQTGTYKRISNEERLKNFNKELPKFKKMKKMEKDKTKTILKNTCTTDSKVGLTHKSFNPKMKPITIKEMEMGNVYKDKYIKFEIITELNMIVSIMFLGKDDNGDLCLIAVYNYENHYGTKDYDKLSYIFQKGKYIIILEPFYKMFGSGEDGIRVEDPNEIIIFDDKEWMNKFIRAENEEESFKLFLEDNKKDFDDLYKEAYKSFSIENYKTALVHFIKLKWLKPSEIKFDIKIAECYFNISYYSKTIEKCDEIMNKKETKIDEKYFLNFLNLKLKSLIKLKKIETAGNLIKEQKELIMNNSQFFEIEEEIKKKMKYLKGDIDLSEIYEKSKNNFDVDIGEYLNKKLEIIYNKDKGISVYSKEKINKGEILVVSKAIMATDIKNKKDINNKCIQYDNPEKDDYNNIGFPLVYKERTVLEEKLSYKISNYPEDYYDLLYLFDGKNKNLNLEERYKNKEINLKKLQRILRYNTKNIHKDDFPVIEGIWYIPSFFNHSCIPNCYYFGFGDVLIIIAVNDIDKNRELFLNYLSNDILPFDERQNMLKSKYDFYCDCELCNYEKNKIKECPEKKQLNEYLIKLNKFLYPEGKDNEDNKIKIMSEKDIKEIVKFLDKNKKIFNCFEKCEIYLKCSLCIIHYDIYLYYEYLEKALKYSENRNYYYEKYSLIFMINAPKYLRSDVRLEFAMKKLKEFYAKYFPNQNKFVDILIKNSHINQK